MTDRSVRYICELIFVLAVIGVAVHTHQYRWLLLLLLVIL